MRVSEKMKSFNVLTDFTRSLDRMLKTQRDLATARRIHAPSDDPGGVTRLIRLKGSLNRMSRYEKNVEDAKHYLLATENSLNQIVDVLAEVNSILLKAENDTLGEEERKILSYQMEEMRNRMVQAGNQDFAGKFIFGGTSNSSPPYLPSSDIADETFTSAFDSAVTLDNINIDSGSVTVTSLDGAVAYLENSDYIVDYETGSLTVLSSGSMNDSSEYLISYTTQNDAAVEINPAGVDGEIFRTIDQGVSLSINVNVNDVFGNNAGLPNLLKDAVAALARNDRDSLSAIRDSIGNQQDNITGIMGQVGAKLNRLDLQIEKLEADSGNFKRLISSIEDTDIPAALIQLQEDQSVYEAALKTSSMIMRNTLLNYL